MPAPIQSITFDRLEAGVLRLDLLDPEISGNKWFKLKANLELMRAQGLNRLLTFGGAHSNHLAATAAAGKSMGFETIGVIRGEEPRQKSPTLLHAIEKGMKMLFVSREQYKNAQDPAFLKGLEEQFGDFYLLPEGGNNKEGVKGCMEILSAVSNYDYIFSAVGTGATFTGLVLSAKSSRVIGINVLKGHNQLLNDVKKNLLSFGNSSIVGGNEVLNDEIIKEHCMIDLYSFNGYAAYVATLVAFKKEFELKTGIPLDYVYTNKVFYAAFDLLKKGKLGKGRVLIIHSGGLQGNEAFEQRFKLNGPD